MLLDPESHHLIHAGLDKYALLISGFRSDATSFDPVKLRAVMDSFRDILFSHLDEEVKDLSKENMLKYVRSRLHSFALCKILTR